MRRRKLVVLSCLPQNVSTRHRFLHQQVQLSLAKQGYLHQLHIGLRFVQQKLVCYVNVFSLIFQGDLPTFAVPIYDGRKRQLNVPNELRNIPDILPRYVGDIPEYSLALVAYTVSTYTSLSGPRRNQLTASLHIHYAVVLHEPSTEITAEVSGDEEKESVNE